MSLYTEQSFLTLRLKTGVDLNAGTNQVILYKKPDGTTGSWPATVDETDLLYNVQNGNIDQAGTWEFQGRIELGGRKAFSEKVRLDFHPNLSQ